MTLPKTDEPTRPQEHLSTEHFATNSGGTTHWPLEIRLHQAAKKLEIDFDNGQSFTYAAEYLRVESPSAEVQGHGPNSKKIIGGCADITIKTIEPVGHYALRIIFSDGHQSGIYSWTYLYKLGQEHAQIWPAYLDNLAKNNLSR